MKRRRIPLTAWLAFVSAFLTLALGGVLATGHYLGAAWDEPVGRLLAGVAATLDLRSPTVVLAVLVLALGVLLAGMATRNVRAQGSSILEDEDLTSSVAEVPMPASIRVILINCDLENVAVHANEVPAFVRGFKEYYSGSTVEGHVYCETALKEESVKAFVASDFMEHDTPHGGQKQVADREMIRGILMRVGRGLASDEQFRVILVTQDTDFVDLVRVLKSVRVPVTVFIRSPAKANQSARDKYLSAGAEIDRFDRFL